MEKIRQPLSSHAKRGFDVAGASEAPFPATPPPPRGADSPARPAGSHEAVAPGKLRKGRPVSFRARRAAIHATALPPPPPGPSPGSLHSQVLRDTYCARPVPSWTQRNRHGPAFSRLIRFRSEHMKHTGGVGNFTPRRPTVCRQLEGLEKFKERLGEICAEQAGKSRQERDSEEKGKEGGALWGAWTEGGSQEGRGP